MLGSRARRWLAIGWIACAGCGSAPAAPRAGIPRTDVAAPRPPPSAPAAAAPAPAPEPAPEPTPPECPADPAGGGRRKPDQIVTLLDVGAAMTVVDLGSGDGFLLCRLSRAVGPRGRVVATEIGRKLVEALRQRVVREQLANVETVLAPTDDVGVAAASADRILIVNVWHHIADRRRYAARLARALAPGGKVVVVDFPKQRRGRHGIAAKRVIAELVAGGIAAAVVTEDLPGQYVIVGAARPSP